MSLFGNYYHVNHDYDSNTDELWQQYNYYHDHERFLAEKKAEEPLDYTVVSVGVMTLGLILLVEISRHHIDHLAHGKPFFHTVLHGVYSELATLGLVELFIYILLKYYELSNKARKEIFADVHFALFYTAIFNAFETVLLASLTTHGSDKLWTQTESLELDHYVEIREEFERVQEECLFLSGRSADSVYNADDNDEILHGFVFDYTWSGLCRLLREVLFSIRNSHLRARYRDLLVQVRFHQLRLQLLEGYDLPLQLKVSEYLKKAELDVLIKLVHVKPVAWLLLTGGLTLIYYLMGIVAFVNDNDEKVGISLSWIYIGCMVSFVVLSLIVYNKMKLIFNVIINLKITNDMDNEVGRKTQLGLFWSGDPQLVIGIIQFMQFGYAVALSVLIIFWDDLKGTINHFWYLLVVVVCYVLSLLVMKQVIQEYTLCTSLGHLVNPKDLQEVVAKFRLEEAQRRQKRRQMTLSTFENDSMVIVEDHVDPHMEDSATTMSKSSGLTGGISVDRTAVLAELVKMDTKSLRTNLPLDSRETLLDREKRIRERRANRKKSVSDGVAAMRNLGSMRNISNAAMSVLDPKDNSFFKRGPAVAKPEPQQAQPPMRSSKSMEDLEAVVKRKNERRPRNKTASSSAIIQSWQNVPTEEVNNNATTGVAKDDTAISRRQRQRRPRTKSASTSAVIQSWQDYSVSEETSPSLDFFLPTKPVGSTTNINSGDVAPTTAAASKPKQENIEEEKEDEEEQQQEHNDSVKNVVDFVPPPSGAVVTRKNKFSGGDDDDDSDVDADTVNTDRSMGGLSDVDDVPNNASESIRSIPKQDPLGKRILHNCSLSVMISKAKDTLGSKVYENISHVFGTITCFFLVGNRVEAMLAETGVIKESTNTFQFQLHSSFWWQVSMHIAFLLIAIMILLLFRGESGKDHSKRTLVVAAGIDILITGTCLATLLIAESQRCCTEDKANLNTDLGAYLRMLAGEDKYYESDDYYDVDTNCCPGWGHRTYGGLGNIEPFTSLVALRVFRFVLAQMIVGGGAAAAAASYEDSSTKGSGSEDNVEGASKDAQTKNSTLRSLLVAHSSRKAMTDIKGTPLELWETAIGRYPDIVAKYGEFSGELFQAMLGLEIVEKDAKDNGQRSASQAKQHSSVTKLAPTPEEPSVETLTADKASTMAPNKSIKLLGKQFADLPPEAQGIIIAGRLGKPVRSRNASMDFSSPGDLNTLPTLAEEAHPHEESALLKSSSTALQSTTAVPEGPVEFEIDTAKVEYEETHDDHAFVAPTARLVRSMRRCERRLLPLLKEWVAVDMVITRFEIVYFEAIDPDIDSGISDPETNTQKSVFLALSATKGGKGLRLCDVAKGRKVVGHFDLTDVTEVHVERDIPLTDLSGWEETELTDNDVLATEFWTGKPSLKVIPETAGGKVDQPRNLRWAKIKEDRLKVISKHHTLLVRFFSDLENAECHSERCAQEENNDAAGTIEKNLSLQWAQTIVRFCGTEQLKQSLPHFGDGTSDELRDYLEVVHYHEKEADKESHRKTLRRTSSVVMDSRSGGGGGSSPSNNTGTNKKEFGHSSSFTAADDKKMSTRGQSVKNFFRSASTNDADPNHATPTSNSEILHTRDLSNPLESPKKITHKNEQNGDDSDIGLSIDL